MKESQVIGLSRRAERALRDKNVYEFWGYYEPRTVARFAAALAHVALSPDSRLLLRYRGHRKQPDGKPPDAPIVARDGREAWHDLGDEQQRTTLVVEAWSESLETVQIWALPAELDATAVASRGDAVLVVYANWIISCGADGAVAQFIPVQDMQASEVERMAAHAAGIAKVEIERETAASTPR